LRTMRSWLLLEDLALGNTAEGEDALMVGSRVDGRPFAANVRSASVKQAFRPENEDLLGSRRLKRSIPLS
jgi:hypothetical protein